MTTSCTPTYRFCNDRWNVLAGHGLVQVTDRKNHVRWQVRADNTAVGIKAARHKIRSYIRG